MPVPDDGKFEIEFRLRQKEREFQQAILLANGVRLEALTDDGVVYLCSAHCAATFDADPAHHPRAHPH